MHAEDAVTVIAKRELAEVMRAQLEQEKIASMKSDVETVTTSMRDLDRRAGRVLPGGDSAGGRATYLSPVRRPRVVPRFKNPSCRAAALVTSILRPPANGPRSLIRTTTVRPWLRFSTRTIVPNGSERGAAVSRFG